VLQLLGIPQPAAMTGKSLIEGALLRRVSGS